MTNVYTYTFVLTLTDTAFVLQQDPTGLDAVGGSGADIGYAGLSNRYSMHAHEALHHYIITLSSELSCV
jgi:hypothetical protein